MTTDTNRPASIAKRGALAALLLGGGIAIGAAGLATAQGAMTGGGWHRGGPRIGMMQFFVHHALENVGATSDQETKVHDIIATAYQKIDPSQETRDEMRTQVLDLLKAPTIDRAAAEKLRAQKIADMDAKSKVIVSAALDAAAQLTPDQRVKLVRNVEARMQDHEREHEHGWGHGFGRDHDGHDHDGTDHGPDAGDHG